MINGGFTDLGRIKDYLDEKHGLEGCMVGRMAYNNPWEMTKIDRELFGSTADSMTRDEIITQYADYAQSEQDLMRDNGFILPNTVLVKPVIHMFSNEYEGGEYRKFMSDKAIMKDYKGRVKDVLMETMDHYRKINPEAFVVRNGVKCSANPSSILVDKCYS